MTAVSNVADAGDPRSVRFRHLDRDDGLSQSFVYSIVQDRQGYMWFGTQEGLNRYDGFDFTVYAHEPDDPESISDESIRTLILDRAGTLWIGTDAGGLSRFDSERETFTNYLHDAADESSIADNRVRVIYEDSAGQLWIGTDGSGLDRFDPETESFEHFRHDPSLPGSLAGAHVWSILEDSEGTLWVATEKGLSQFDAGNKSFTNFVHQSKDATSLNDNQLRVLYEDTDGNLWVGTEAGGLNRFDRDAGSFEHFMHDPDDPYSISANRINTIFEDDAGVLWVGTVRGLNAWDPTTRNFERYLHDPNDRYSIANDTVLSIFQDRGKVLWIGTYAGLSRWNQATRAMLHFKNDVNDPASLSANTITSFAEDSTGTLWIGTFGGGLNYLDPLKETFGQLRHLPDVENSLSSDRVMAVHVDRQNVLWAGTRDAGLNRYDRRNGTFRRFRHDPANPASLSADGVTCILEASDGGLWIGTFGGGLNYFQPDNETFRIYRSDADDPETLSSDRVLVMFEDAAGSIWVGTYGGGLNRFDPSTNSFTRFTAEPDRPDGLSGNEISMIQEDTNGDLWIGVKGGGLHRWRRSDRESDRPSFQRFSELDGLADSTLYSGVWDEQGALWLSSAHGLSRMDVESLEFRNYDTSHGLQGDEFNLAAGFRSSSGELYFGGMNGFNAFDPEMLLVNARPPQVAITRFLGMNQPIDLGDNRSNGEPIAVGYGQHLIGFEFVALDYAAPENNRYQYRLDGLDDAWIDAGTKRDVNYANLPAGDYTFRVRAANNDGVWSEQHGLLRFRLLPPPWQTGWAYALYFLFSAAMILGLFRAHANRARQAATARHAEELGRIQARLTDAQRIAGVGNWEWSIPDNKLWWSDEIYRLFQAEDTTTPVSYDAYLQHVHPADRSKVNRAVERAVSKKEPYSIEIRILRNDGSVRVVHEQAEVTFDAAGQPLKMAGTVLDITERKRAENEVLHRAEFQALLAGLSSDLIRAQHGDIEHQLERGLELVGKHFALDAINIRWLRDETEELQTYYRWTRCSTDEPPELLISADYPWTIEQLRSGKPVAVDEVGLLSANADIDGISYRHRGIKSFVLIPLMLDETLVGSAAFSTANEKRSWSAETIRELKLIAENIAGAIARGRAVQQIEQLTTLLQEENFYLRQEVSLANRFDEIIGEDKKLKECLQLVEKVAPTDVAVLILGETGTGKELLARAIHRLSARCDGPMISVNCPALPATLIESELFGHEKGAFTGADSRRIGRFELAEGGTLFLDEIGELPLEVQSKLLRVLQTGEFDRLGGTTTRRANVRLIAATNRDLRRATESGEFRADLYYRISSFPIALPALRERKDDIPLLSEHFVRKHAERFGKSITAISARMLKELVGYEWPGNIRELESIIERSLISADTNSVLELPGPLRLMGNFTQSKSTLVIDDKSVDLSSVERAHIIEVLDTTNWKISGKNGAADILGVPSSTLRSKMKRLGIQRQSI